MAEIIDGKALAQKVRTELKSEVEELKREGILPKLAVIMVGDNKASKIYVRSKSKACEDVGIVYEEYLLNADITMDKLLNLIHSLNEKKDVHGILLQSPLPMHLDINQAFAEISPQKDVDGFHPVNVGKLALGQDTFVSCTPYGIIKMLEEYQISIEGKNAVVIRKK